MSDFDKFYLGELDATQKLTNIAIDYTQQIVIAEHSAATIGSPSVQTALNALQQAAVGYALMMIFSEKLLSVEEIQRIDDTLTARLDNDLTEVLA